MKTFLAARAALSMVAVLSSSCSDFGSGKPPGDRPDSVEIKVRFVPLPSDGYVAPVVRVLLESGRTIPEGLSLYEGALSTRELKDLAAGASSKTLQARQVPILRWPHDAETEVAHLNRLQAGATYTLAVPSWEWSQVFQVTPSDDLPFLKRVWPPTETSATASVGIWCMAQPAHGLTKFGPRPASLSPGLVPGQFDFGAIADLGQGCVRWIAAGGEPSSALVPPPTVELEDGTIARVDPTPLEVRIAGGGNAGSTCLPGESVFGPICALVQDDRVVLSSRQSEWWIGIRVEELAWADRVDALHPVVLRPLSVDSEHNFLLHAMDVAGVSGQWHETMRTAPILPHVVINELMANPAGPEPEQEWVELFNDGQGVVQLEGWILEDSGGETLLPDCQLGPGQFALIVNEAFDSGSWVDRPPSPEAVILRVPHLGTGGLSNNGEPLRLRTKDGKTVSAVPSIASPKQSNSIARIAPDALDTIPGSFLNSVDGGTPGAPNRL